MKLCVGVEYDADPTILRYGRYLSDHQIILGVETKLDSAEKLDDPEQNLSLIIESAELEYLPRELKDHLPNLRHISLSNSIITNIIGPDFIDKGLEDVEKLEFFHGDNPAVLTTDAFLNLPNLQEFRTFYAPIQELHEGVFRTNKKLISIDFQHTKISTIPEHLFAGLENLREVTFYASPIKILPGNLFLGNKSLKKIKFQLTRIQELPENLISQLLELESFSVRLSDIRSVPGRFFPDNKKLSKIQLDWNKIEKIPEETFDNLTELSLVDLRKNSCINGTFDSTQIEKLKSELKNCN